MEAKRKRGRPPKPGGRWSRISVRVPKYVVDALEASAKINNSTLSKAAAITLMIWADNEGFTSFRPPPPKF